MLESMTAYGSSEVDIDNTRFTIELRSVNHRFFEARIKMPSSMMRLDPAIRKLLKDRLNRGSVDCFIRSSRINSEADSGAQTVTLDTDLLSQYVKLFDEIKFKFKIGDTPKISDIVRIPNLFNVEEKDLSAEELDAKLMQAVESCTDKVLEMQKKEGKALRSVLEANLSAIEEHIRGIKERSRDLLEGTLVKIKERLSKVLTGTEVPQDRILVEAGILAEKLDITEEIDRLGSHIKQFRDELNKNEVGRKLDFIVQEINREVNTIASKSEDKDVVYACVESKSLIEKIREQVQNVK